MSEKSVSDSENGTGSADLIFRGGLLMDGSNAAPVMADVAVTGDRIVAVGALDAVSADREIEISGHAIAPGFIDVHTHDDRYLLTNPDMQPKVSQGVTTVVVGNCGFSLAPSLRPDPKQFPFSLWLDREEYIYPDLEDYMRQLDAKPAATNAAVLVGHSSLRYGAMAELDRPANDAEIGKMQKILDECLQAGAFGMSSGLFYPPAASASAEEVTAIAGTMSAYNGIYTAHIRDEAAHLLESIEEAAAIAAAAGVQLVISHHKASGLKNFGKTLKSIPKIDSLRKRQRLSLDVYPYIASSTMLLPHIVDRAEKVLITWSDRDSDIAGDDLDDIAAARGVSRRQAAEELTPAGAIYFQMDEADVQRVLQYENSMVGSDGIPDDPHPHPRLWGTFPRVLGHYARDLKLFPVHEAVRRMSGLPAEEFGLKDRGRIRPGAFADLVVFDPATVADTATFSAPTTPAAGIRSVWVNGEAVWQKSKGATGARPGQVLKLSESNRRAN